jgi:FkbM family methyltransferase
MSNFFVQAYIWVGFYYKKFFSKNLKGIGFVQKGLSKDFVFTFQGKKIFYNHEVEGSYDFLLIGKSNEPETHHFFQRVIPLLGKVNFVDVGASVGEMVIGVSIYKNIESIYAFEPREECVSALQKTVQLNHETRANIFPNLVSSTEEEIDMYLNPGGSSTGIFNEGGAQMRKVRSVQLDTVLPHILENTIILIDVEGAEPLVLKSGSEFIKNNHPLIIFEYNQLSKKHFTLEEISAIIGEKYRFYRLKGDGTLDLNFDNSWNVVAVPQDSIFDFIKMH